MTTPPQPPPSPQPFAQCEGCFVPFEPQDFINVLEKRLRDHSVQRWFFCDGCTPVLEQSGYRFVERVTLEDMDRRQQAYPVMTPNAGVNPKDGAR
jgi:hypothetical protein